MRADKYIVMRGLKVAVPYAVHSFDATGWEFVGRHRTHTRALICHMTGAENPPAAMYRNMLNAYVFAEKTGVRVPAPKSIHFCVDQKGDIYQMADTELRGAHAIGKGGDRSANSWSVGIEFIGRGSDLKSPSRGYKRDRIEAQIHGQQVSMDELFDAQITAGLVLIETLCGLYGLPMRVPEEPSGEIMTRELSDPIYDTYRGVLSHPHVERGKLDLSPKLMRAVQKRGRELDQARV